METPSSSIARSHPTTSPSSSVASQEKIQEDAKPSNAKPDGSALVDITNDSPIVGLAMGSLKTTPSSSVVKSRGRPTRTPGSGEALLRGQVKTLLQKVEEETELMRPPPRKDPPQAAAPFRALLSHLLSPRALLAPTPTNTPQILGLQTSEEELKIPLQAAPVSGAPLPEKEQLGECQLNRALLFDSPDKSETSESSTICSALTYEGSNSPEVEDCSSAWSTRANAGSRNDDDDEEEEEERLGGDACKEEVEEDYGVLLDELCQGLSEMSMAEGMVVPEFAGKHTRFVYNSDDEMEGEEEVKATTAAAASPNVLVLKGLPVPEGKHLRFQEDEEDSD